MSVSLVPGVAWRAALADVTALRPHGGPEALAAGGRESRECANGAKPHADSGHSVPAVPARRPASRYRTRQRVIGVSARRRWSLGVARRLEPRVASAHSAGGERPAQGPRRPLAWLWPLADRQDDGLRHLLNSQKGSLRLLRLSRRSIRRCSGDT